MADDRSLKMNTPQDLLAPLVLVGQRGNPAGTGFLIRPDIVCTCAHVVCDALGLDRDTRDAPEVDVPVYLARSKSQLSGRVETWSNGYLGATDLASLRLQGEAPAPTSPASLLGRAPNP